MRHWDESDSWQHTTNQKRLSCVLWWLYHMDIMPLSSAMVVHKFLPQYGTPNCYFSLHGEYNVLPNVLIWTCDCAGIWEWTLLCPVFVHHCESLLEIKYWTGSKLKMVNIIRYAMFLHSFFMHKCLDFWASPGCELIFGISKSSGFGMTTESGLLTWSFWWRHYLHLFSF